MNISHGGSTIGVPAVPTHFFRAEDLLAKEDVAPARGRGVANALQTVRVRTESDPPGES
jgi:hypothetical protein